MQPYLFSQMHIIFFRKLKKGVVPACLPYLIAGPLVEPYIVGIDN
jgi:ABC-type anion transport system duplicated permease subunit